DAGDKPHFDFVSYHTIPRSGQWVRRKIGELWRMAGGKKCSHKNIRTYASNVADYVAKYARLDNTKAYNWFTKHYPMPDTKLQITWHSRNFYGRKPQWKQVERYWNGEHQILERKISPQQQCWQE